MFCLGVTYTFPAGKEEEAAGYLRELIQASRKEPGCRLYVVHRDKEDPAIFFIYEQYDDQAAFDAHVASPHFQKYGVNGLRKIATKRDAHFYVPLTE